MSRARAFRGLARQLRRSYHALDKRLKVHSQKAGHHKYGEITRRERAFPPKFRSTHDEKTSRAIRASIKAEEKYFVPNRRMAVGRIPGNRSRSDRDAARHAGYYSGRQRSASPLGRMGRNSRQKLFNRITKRKVRSQQLRRKRR
jgi:hypothetical protein